MNWTPEDGLMDAVQAGAKVAGWGTVGLIVPTLILDMVGILADLPTVGLLSFGLVGAIVGRIQGRVMAVRAGFVSWVLDGAAVGILVVTSYLAMVAPAIIHGAWLFQHGQIAGVSALAGAVVCVWTLHDYDPDSF